MNRRSFMGLLAAAPVAIAAAPVVATMTRHDVTFGMLEAVAWSRQPGDTILVCKPMRFVVREVHDFTWHTDEFLEVTPATPQELAAYRAANYVESRIRMESVSYVPAAC